MTNGEFRLFERMDTKYLWKLTNFANHSEKIGGYWDHSLPFSGLALRARLLSV